MEDDEDDFFAYQAAKSLNNKRAQLKQFLQTPVNLKQISSSTDSESDDETDLIPSKKTKATTKPIVKSSIQSVVVQSAEPEKTKDSIRNEIDAIVTSCFTTNKEKKRKIKLGKRTAADDQEYENEDEYLAHTSHRGRHSQMSRSARNAMNISQLEEDDEKPLVEKQMTSTDDDNNEDGDEPSERDDSHGLEMIMPVKSLSFNKVTLNIDHCDGRQLTLTLPLSTTLKSLCQQVAEHLHLSSIYLVYNDRTLKLDEKNHSMTLKQLDFSTDADQFLESYPLIRKLKISIQTSSNRRSSLPSKREYTMMDTDRFEVIFNAYKSDTKATNVRFEFDGDTLDPRATPNDYEMVDEEILDAFILPQTSTTDKS
ncbi:unnamed protein product [Adineta ricciae]|uniref:Rad60/SUMO-like domain-containing protein n=1 Tax=Adineta ricciae TaxID=249248 RepID=A0A815CP59_ADIRI|nr:unnamed protein product [Adineta ricciae]